MRMPLISEPVRRRGSRRSVAWMQSSGIMMSQELSDLATEDAGIDLEEGAELPLDLGDDEALA